MRIKCSILTLASLLIFRQNMGAVEPQGQEPDKRTLVANTMRLTPEQEKKFWPLYDEYQIELNKLNADRMAVMTKFGINYNIMTDELAQELLDQTLNMEKKRFTMKKNLVAKFSKVFPVKVVARYFQIENKLDAMAMAAAVEKVPLAR